MPPLPPKVGAERDHIVPLCLGGPDSASNMRYQPWDTARRRDRLEAAGREVCDKHTTSLSDGWAIFQGDWRVGYMRFFGEQP
jgi:hypothetical protein